MTSRQDVIRVARSMVGTKYRHGGRTRKSVDCGGLLIAIATELGIDHIAPPLGYSRHPDGRLVDHVHAGADPQKDPQPGDILVFWVDRGSRLPQHVGIITECGGLIHADMRSRRVVETTQNPFTSSQVIGAFTFRGVS